MLSLISIRDLAKLAEVSAATVSRVLNDDPTICVTDETRNRIKTLAKQMNYTPKNRKHSAKSTALEMSIGLITRHTKASEENDPYFKNIRLGIEEAAKKWRLKVDLLFRIRDENKEWENIKNYGAIIIIGRMSSSFYEKIMLYNHNIIVVDDPYCPKNIYSVYNDFYDKTTEILDLLIKYGHRNISYIGGYQSIADEHGDTTSSTLDSRLIAYQSYMKNHHLDEFMNCYLGEWSSQSGYSLTIELLKNNQIPSAIVVGSDPIAIGVYHALKSEGYHIPKDISIISFDDLSLPKYLQPTLSSVYLNTKDMGKIALNIAKSLISKEFSTPFQVICNSEIKLRDSITQHT